MMDFDQQKADQVKDVLAESIKTTDASPTDIVCAVCSLAGDALAALAQTINKKELFIPVMNQGIEILAKTYFQCLGVKTHIEVCQELSAELPVFAKHHSEIL